MSKLTLYKAEDPRQFILQTLDGDKIAEQLSQVGVRFERWQANQPVASGDSQEAVIAAYQEAIDKLMQEEGYVTVDVISMTPDHPDKVALRQKFLSEHTHSEDEVRFFVDGDGLFSLHIDDYVYEVLCSKGDLISVPANTTHWFDMGDSPRFTAIRLFNNPEGWVANYTGSDIADNFSRFEDALSDA